MSSRKEPKSVNHPRTIFLSVHGTHFRLGSDVAEWKSYIRRSPEMCGWFCWTDGTHDAVLYREDEPPVGGAMLPQWEAAFTTYLADMKQRRTEQREFAANWNVNQGAL